MLDGEGYRKKTASWREIELSVAKCEEAQRELKSLIATAEATIRETRELMAELAKVLAKRL